MERTLLEIILPALLAVIVVSAIHPKLVMVALRKSIVDNPNARKLNKQPIPVLGGVGIFVGILISGCLFSYINGVEPMFAVLSAATMMLCMGVIDDIVNIRAVLKLMMQILAVALVMFVGEFRIDSLGGLWGVYELPEWASIVLTFLTGVGIINALNLIDGVDGLSSGYGIITSIVCGTVFYMAGDVAFTVLCFAAAGSLIPFFIHNIFGRKYKMFMGDGGSLVLGLLFAVMIMQFVHTGGLPQIKGVVSFVLAVFSVPVFDTLRVMSARILSGRSPFNPDKTHLHHVFIDMGYHHPATTLIVLCLDIFIVGVWFVTERIAVISVDTQFYIVAAVGLVSNVAIYGGVALYRKYRPEKYAAMRNRITDGQIRRGTVLKKLQRVLDRL
jgi:UDP-N-acetylmuramyl pentapeptide phosphotransferase/UDP-N-acetylglucosamine-1-phosphate transferase